MEYSITRSGLLGSQRLVQFVFVSFLFTLFPLSSLSLTFLSIAILLSPTSRKSGLRARLPFVAMTSFEKLIANELYRVFEMALSSCCLVNFSLAFRWPLSFSFLFSSYILIDLEMEYFFILSLNFVNIYRDFLLQHQMQNIESKRNTSSSYIICR